MNYEEFIESKTQLGGDYGFAPTFIPDFLFGYQQSLVEWACRKGRAAMFADCGLGKTPMQLTWAQNVALREDKPVLILTPLAVSSQTVAEGSKFGIEAERSADGKFSSRIVVTNYERLHYFNPDDFAGAVCDESGILKNFEGARRDEITQFMRKLKYRLLTTATPSPNDYIELGTSSEALGYLGYIDMLGKYFKNDQGNSVKMMRGAVISGSKWRFKGHAERDFWRWVCSWSRAVRKPSDIGFPDDGFNLPELNEREHMINANKLADGMLFALPAHGLKEQREERSRTNEERCEKAAQLVCAQDGPSISWCELNREGDLMESLIPDSVQVSGADSDDEKEEKLMGFVRGDYKKLITKAKIGALGLNFQHCAHMTTFPTNSYEQHYQMVRRCWRFGQKNPVKVDIITTEGGLGVLANMKRKAAQANEMFSKLVAEMNNAKGFRHNITKQPTPALPSWIQ